MYYFLRIIRWSVIFAIFKKKLLIWTKKLHLQAIYFLNIFWCDLASLLFSLVFCHQVVHLFHLVFRQSWNSNPRPRTMAWIVSPQHSPLDQGASPRQYLFICLFICLFSHCFYTSGLRICSLLLYVLNNILKLNLTIKSTRCLRVKSMVTI